MKNREIIVHEMCFLTFVYFMCLLINFDHSDGSVVCTYGVGGLIAGVTGQ